MERSAERSFCCGAGGARMWMEERIGERINENRTREAVATGADQIAVGCPFCRVMLDDGLTSAQSKGEAGEAVEVLDVAQMLLASVKGVSATRTRAGVGAGAGTAPGPTAPPAAGESDSSPTPGEAPSEPPAAQAAVAGGSLFDDDAGSLFGDAVEQADKPQATEAKSEVEGTQDAEGKLGGSLFGDGASLFDTPVEEETQYKAEPERATEAKPTDSKAETRTEVQPALGSEIPAGTSLFDLGEAEPEPAVTPEPTGEAAGQATDWEVGDDIPEGQSLFDVNRPDPVTILDADDEPEPEPEEKPKPARSGETNTPRTDADINQSGSLFEL
jgi:hypothetical protein